MKTIDWLYAGIIAFALLIGIASFACMVRSSKGCEFENDPIPGVPGENDN